MIFLFKTIFFSLPRQKKKRKLSKPFNIVSSLPHLRRIKKEVHPISISIVLLIFIFSFIAKLYVI